VKKKAFARDGGKPKGGEGGRGLEMKKGREKVSAVVSLSTSVTFTHTNTPTPINQGKTKRNRK
jgi:hypothetical protein